MRIDLADSDKVRAVVNRLRSRDLAELLAVNPADDRGALADLLADRYGRRTDVFCASRNGDPVAIGASIQGRPRVLTIMFFATDRFPEIAWPLTRFLKQRYFPPLIAAGVHRIEALSMEGYDETHRWLGFLGMKPEGPALRGFGKNRENFVSFAWVAP